MVDVPVFMVAPEFVVRRKKATIYQLLETEQWNFISYLKQFYLLVMLYISSGMTSLWSHYGIIIFVRDSRHFTNVRKL